MPTSCPKCGFDNASDSPQCDRCGVIFAKIKMRDEPAWLPATRSCKSESAMGELFLSLPDSNSSALFWARGAALLVLLLWGGVLVFSGMDTDAGGKGILHLINLPFHEAGHVLLRPLGQFVTSLGGTLGQLLIPFVCLAALLLKNRDPFGGAVCLWWLGENFIDIAPYVNDAQAGELPLVGGNFGNSSPYGFHDWEYLLTETGLLQHDHRIALFFHGAGVLIMALSVFWGVLLLKRQYVSAKARKCW